MSTAAEEVSGGLESGLVAALDLGSNSFHMIVGRLDRGQLIIVDRMRERVRLGAGLDAKKNLTVEAQDRALACLRRLGERVREMPAGRVRAVGTNTLRQAKNGALFLEKAREVLGHPIEVIAGREEARLIYLGVTQTMPSDAAQRLVVDIGGGSTECVIGERGDLIEADSLYMGCVSYSLRHFADGKLTKEAFALAEIDAQLELQSIARRFRSLGWDEAVGCSGTIHAIHKIVRAAGSTAPGVTAEGLAKLKRDLIAAGSMDKVAIDGLQDDRKPVIAGGVAILSAVFDALKIDVMVPSPGALREGALYDLVGRIRHEDVRDRTIRWFCSQYSVDMEQVARVERASRRLVRQVYAAWGLDQERARSLLSWAAHLHELGLAISHTAYHKHGAYLVENADMAGFSRNDQQMLAAIVLGHRRKLKESYFAEVLPEHRRSVILLTVIFRLAVTLNRNRSDEPLPDLFLKAKKDRLSVSFPEGWLEARPLTRADLAQQTERVRRVGVSLVIRSATAAPDED